MKLNETGHAHLSVDYYTALGRVVVQEEGDIDKFLCLLSNFVTLCNIMLQPLDVSWLFED